jgi:hypothetical protein
MKRFVAKMMKLSFGPTGCDLFRSASRKKRRALRKLCARKWRIVRESEKASQLEAAEQLELVK